MTDYTKSSDDVCDYSYVKGEIPASLIEHTIGEVLIRTATRRPDHDALIVPHQNVRWTWAELGRRVDLLAQSLLSLGMKPGDRLGIWSPNCAEWVLIQLATARAGIILVTINPAYRAHELQHALTLSGCRALVLARAFKSNDPVSVLLQVAPEFAVTAHSDALPELEMVIQIGTPAVSSFIAFDDLVRDQEFGKEKLQVAAMSLKASDPINIQFTSGTTGAPKGATLTHSNILNNGANVGTVMRISQTDRICIPVPLYHCFGMVMGVLNCVAHGAAMVFPGEVFDAGQVLTTVALEHCTALYGVPTMFLAELEHPSFATFDLSSLRTGIMAGAPCPIAVMKRVIDAMHMHGVTICYGMTETSPVSFQTAVDADLETRVSTVGTVHPFIEAKVVNDTGHVTARGEKGELLVRGYSVMEGYWNDPIKTAEAIDADGWMHTGDLATIDKRGRARIVGRIKDMIIRGGENIYPAEIEDSLFRHPAIAEVAVFGVPDARYGEEVCTWIKLRGTLAADEVVAYCKAHLAPFKVPRHVRFVDTFPMTVTGKVQKFAMREAMCEMLSRTEIETA